jgi:phosphoserine phosphatase RsbX
VGEPVTAAPLQVAVASSVYPGETESGDAAVVRDVPGATLVAAIDGLGHGPDAAGAARAVVAVLERTGAEPLQTVVQRCHAAATETRGAALTVASFDAERPRMWWLAVGNVAGVLVRGAGARSSVVSRPGIVGASLPALHPSEIALEDGDLLVLATDGLATGFAKEALHGEPPQALAERLLARFATGGDDALVVVARYAGTG